MLKKYQQILQKINEFDFSGFNDADLLKRIAYLKERLIKSPNKIIPELLAIIREVIDRRLGIWNLFNSDLSPHLTTENIKKIYNEVKDKLPSIDRSEIHLKSEFYSEVRRLRRPQDNLTFMPFDVQILGALALLDGNLAEMATGEGKTVVAVFPASIWALSGKKVHIATVNDYLALRDCLWMNPVYSFIGLKVDCILSYMSDSERRNSYKADIVYGNNYEFGFDYLRDNLKNKVEERVQSELDYVIIDEIDSILMDEAGTPLIISGSPISNQSNYWRFKDAVESLIKRQKEIVNQLFNSHKTENDQLIKIIRLIQILMADPWNADLLNYLSENKDIVKKINAVWARYISARSEYKLEQDLLYVIDEKNRSIKLTDMGIAFVEELLGKGFLTLADHSNSSISYACQNSHLKGYLNTSENIRNFLQLLRAYVLYHRDEDYIIHNGKIIIVDEYTGRLSYGKKYEEGLHQALECKEGLSITPENRVMGKITHSNYFRLYKKMVGMTATAHTEADEFKKLYKLQVIRIPTNKPVIRVDLPDRFFKTEDEKIDAIVDDIKECYAIGRPVLIGTRSVEKSERLSKILSQHNIPHNVLNAKNHSEEAEIIKNAGQPYAVTIATNMAGRGTDIKISSENDIDKLGLHVIGTERHLARRIDQQLAGRAGRQGDHGSSRFYLSLQDDLFRIFADDEMPEMIKAIEKNQYNKLVSLAKKAQRKSEETSYNVRKYLIEIDEVTDNQRKLVYKMRREILSENDINKKFQSIISEYVEDLLAFVADSNENFYEKWAEMKEQIARDFGLDIPNTDLDGLNYESAKALLINIFQKALSKRESKFDIDYLNKMKKAVMLSVLDDAWTDFLSLQHEIDNSMILRSYVKSDIITDYRLTSSKMFRDMLRSVRYETIKAIFTISNETLSHIKKDIVITDQIKDLLQISDLSER